MSKLRRRQRPELESYDEYARVVVNLDGKTRVIECRDGVQWIVQRAVLRNGIENGLVLRSVGPKKRCCAVQVVMPVRTRFLMLCQIGFLKAHGRLWRKWSPRRSRRPEGV